MCLNQRCRPEGRRDISPSRMGCRTDSPSPRLAGAFSAKVAPAPGEDPYPTFATGGGILLGRSLPACFLGVAADSFHLDEVLDQNGLRQTLDLSGAPAPGSAGFLPGTGQNPHTPGWCKARANHEPARLDFS